MTECEHCGTERKLYHPCPQCGRPTFKPPAQDGDS